VTKLKGGGRKKKRETLDPSSEEGGDAEKQGGKDSIKGDILVRNFIPSPDEMACATMTKCCEFHIFAERPVTLRLAELEYLLLNLAALTNQLARLKLATADVSAYS
jgi:hypothetical protein